MGKLKIAIIIVLIIIISTIIAIIVINSINPGDVAISQKLVTPGYEIENPFQQMPEITTRVEYNAINNSISKYLQTLNINNSIYFGRGEDGEQISIVTDEEKKEKVINLLSENYISENKINVDTLERYIQLLKETVLYVPVQIKALTVGNTKTYVADVIIYDYNYKIKDEINLIVNIDYSNQTFSIEPTKNKYSDITTAHTIDTIQKNEDNQYIIGTINTENIIKDYINNYKRLALLKPEIVYERLDEEYRNKRFGNLENFEIYVDKNKEEIKKINLDKYQVINYENYSEYIGVDKNGLMYIFDEKKLFDYNIKLDTYTIISDNFKETYNSGNNQKKVMMNIDKWVQMLNNRDYKAAYEVLDKTFREDNFGTADDFEEYMRTIYPYFYDLEFGELEEEEGLYIQEITLKNKNDVTDNGRGQHIIMQLEEGTTNFVMSFRRVNR